MSKTVGKLRQPEQATAAAAQQPSRIYSYNTLPEMTVEKEPKWTVQKIP